MGGIDSTTDWLSDTTIAEKAIFVGAVLVLVAVVGFTAAELLG
jgi:hypothetical protein